MTLFPEAGSYGSALLLYHCPLICDRFRSSHIANELLYCWFPKSANARSIEEYMIPTVAHLRYFNSRAPALGKDLASSLPRIGYWLPFVASGSIASSGYRGPAIVQSGVLRKQHPDEINLLLVHSTSASR